MTVDPIYSDGKLAVGCLQLAKHPGRIKERLAHSAGEFAGVNVAAFRDPAVGEMWADIWRRLTAIRGENNQGAIAATLDSMDEDAACELASDIMELWQVVESGRRS